MHRLGRRVGGIRDSPATTSTDGGNRLRSARSSLGTPYPARNTGRLAILQRPAQYKWSANRLILATDVRPFLVHGKEPRLGQFRGGQSPRKRTAEARIRPHADLATGGFGPFPVRNRSLLKSFARATGRGSRPVSLAPSPWGSTRLAKDMVTFDSLL